MQVSRLMWQKTVQITAKRKPRLRYAMARGSILAIVLKVLVHWKLFEAIIVHQLSKK
ncbi:hypothetical protein [Oceanobacillus timonensis]|uniref:hypothetical protein n=1 Tax=Oceanobacillus timonensis TaxID=1926285 RepID=UPI0015C4A6EF|nr:hypothetical protein [Oceanobacillus timonensis]